MPHGGVLRKRGEVEEVVEHPLQHADPRLHDGLRPRLGAGVPLLEQQCPLPVLEAVVLLAVGEAADPMPFTDGQLRQLFEVNQLDYELLCYAQALRSSRLAVLAATSSENGQSEQRSSEDRQNKQHKSTKQESRKQKSHGKQKGHGKQDGKQQHRKQKNKQNRDGERLVGIAPVGFQKREP